MRYKLILPKISLKLFLLMILRTKTPNPKIHKKTAISAGSMEFLEKDCKDKKEKISRKRQGRRNSEKKTVNEANATRIGLNLTIKISKNKKKSCVFC